MSEHYDVVRRYELEYNYMLIVLAVIGLSAPGVATSYEAVQGVAGNKAKGEFEVEAQFLSKLHTNNG
jgi:hypothetical protein